MSKWKNFTTTRTRLGKKKTKKTTKKLKRTH